MFRRLDTSGVRVGECQPFGWVYWRMWRAGSSLVTGRRESESSRLGRGGADGGDDKIRFCVRISPGGGDAVALRLVMAEDGTSRVDSIVAVVYEQCASLQAAPRLSAQRC